MLSLAGIRRYPVKSCRGEDLSSAIVEPWGLAGDRRWMITDSDGVAITAREVPRMLLIDPLLTDSGVRLRAAGALDLPELDVAAPGIESVGEVTVWSSTFGAARTCADADAWVSAATGRDARLVYLDDPTRRATNPLFSEPADRVSFADAYPMLMVTEDSWHELNRLIAGGPLADEGPLPIVRFRPNLIVRGAAAWAEDGWRRVRIDDATFRVVKGCDRCVLTTIDPVTAAKGKEPIATLARHRRWDGRVWFGMNLLPDSPGSTLRVGAEVEVLRSVPRPDGPPR
jgi:uncharacterized protein YcbX